MDESIRVADVAELADAAARRAIETGEPQPNPFEPGTVGAIDFKRRYEVSLLRHSSHEEADGSA